MLLRNFAYCLVMLFFFACQKEFSYEGGGSPGNNNNEPPRDTIGKGSWSFEEGPNKYAGPVDTAYLTKEDGKRVLLITGKTANSRERISLQITSSSLQIEKKTYSTIKGEVRFNYININTNSKLYSAAPYQGGDIYVTIVSIDSVHVKGTFKGLAIDSVNKSREIVKGQFIAPLKVVTGASARGKVMLWAKDDCNGPVRVKVNSDEKTITSFQSSAPSCGEDGTATYSLPVGEYAWSAYCGKDSVTGTVRVKEDSCSKLLIEFIFRPAPVTETSKDSCRVKDVYSSGTFKHQISSRFENDRAALITFPVDVYQGYVFPIDHAVTYWQDSIGIHDSQYFLLDAQQRVIEYHGYAEANNWNSQRVVIKYSYSNDNLVHASVHRADQSVLREIDLTWEQGNLVKVITNYFTSGTRTEIDYEYFTDKKVQNMPYFGLELPELVFYQSAINFGAWSKNIIRKCFMKSYGEFGRLLSSQEYDFNGYLVDDNNYVTKFIMSEASSFSNISFFTFSYYCFK